MALEGLERLDKMSAKELRRRAKETLDTYIEKRGEDQHTLLIDAQFYLRELESRAERRSRRIDILLEFVIIVGIAWEIREGYQQSAALEQVATNAVTTATVLQGVQSTMADMNRTIQAEREEASRVSVEGAFDGASIVTITNKGRPSLLVYGTKVGNAASFLQIANVIPGSGQRPVNVTLAENAQVIMRREMDAHQGRILPIEIYLESDDGTQYVATTTLTGTRNPINDFIGILMDRLEVAKRRWRK